MARHRTSKEEQRRHVDRWIASGLSKAAYCRTEQLSYHLLDYWARRHAPFRPPFLSQSREDEGFIELSVPRANRMDSRHPSPAVVIQLPGGVEIACGVLPDPHWLRGLIEVAKSC